MTVSTGSGLHPFEYQKPTDKSVEDLKGTRVAYKVLYDQLMLLAPSRERSIAITKLEESSMWINKGIVFNQVNPDCEEGNTPHSENANGASIIN